MLLLATDTVTPWRCRICAGANPRRYQPVGAATHQEQVRRRQHREADAGIGQLPRQLLHLRRRHGGELGGVADADPPAIAALLGLFDHPVEVRAVGIEIEVDVEVDVHVVTPGKLEDQPDMLARVRIGIGTAAYQIAAALQGRFQHRQGFRLVGQALLSEDADFEVDGEGVVLLELQDGIEGAKAGAGIDFDEASEFHGAVQDRLLQHPRGAGVDVLAGESGLRLGGLAHRFGQRALANGAAVEDAGFVEMDV